MNHRSLFSALTLLCLAPLITSCSSDPQDGDNEDPSSDSSNDDENDSSADETDSDSESDSSGDKDDDESSSDDDESSGEDDDPSEDSDDEDDTDDPDDEDDEEDNDDEDDEDDDVEDGVAPYPQMIDDLEDGDGAIYSEKSEGRKGYWFVSSDGSSDDLTPKSGEFEAAEGGDGDSKYYACLQGEGFNSWGALMGFHLASTGAEPEIYNVEHTGIRFKAKGKGNMQVHLVTSSVVPSADGGHCDIEDADDYCNDSHFAPVELSDEWKTYTYFFGDADFRQNGWGWGVSMNPEESLTILFRTDSETEGKAFDLQVDDIEFIDDEVDPCDDEYRGLRTGRGNRPFPQRVDRAGIKPNHRCPEDLEADIIRLYESWKEKYVRENSMGHYIEMEGTCPTGDAYTTSEAHGYGMLLFALMAGYDPEAQEIFDSMLRFARANPSTITPGLMNGCVTNGSGAANSATDGDLDIAYALLLADDQWGGYGDDARGWIAAQQNERVARSNGRMTLGDWDSSSDRSRPSDWMYGHFRMFAAHGDSNRWTNILDTSYEMIAAIQDGYAPDTGLLPDFVYSSPVQPAYEWLLETELDGHFYYNACRVPMRIGMDFGFTEDSRAKEALDKLIGWTIDATKNNPLKFMAGYYLDGTVAISPDSGEEIYWNDMPFTAPILVGASYDAKHQYFLNVGWEIMADRRGWVAHNYFADSLSLLSMLYLTGNWWEPSH